MRIYSLFVAVLLLIGMAAGCRSTAEKRINKDIIGINEQLYDLEKNQIRDSGRLKTMEGQFKLMKKEETRDKEKEKSQDFDEVYKQGYKYYLEQDYAGAIRLFNSLTKQFSSDSIIDNALYWQAESYLKSSQPRQALLYYQLIYRYFPFSNKADYALYKIGLIYTDMQEYPRALLAFNRMVREYPDSDLYKTVSIKIKQLKNKRRRGK